MVKRVDVEYLLEMAKQCGDETQAELCRAWLALDAAPEAGVYVIGTGDGEDLLTLDPRESAGSRSHPIHARSRPPSSHPASGDG